VRRPHPAPALSCALRSSRLFARFAAPASSVRRPAPPPLVSPIYPELAGKIVGMLLELDPAEISEMLASEPARNERVEEVCLPKSPPPPHDLVLRQSERWCFARRTTLMHRRALLMWQALLVLREANDARAINVPLPSARGGGPTKLTVRHAKRGVARCANTKDALFTTALNN
jgi:hypothetical protein